jgi:hypothetical protein
VLRWDDQPCPAGDQHPQLGTCRHKVIHQQRRLDSAGGMGNVFCGRVQVGIWPFSSIDAMIADSIGASGRSTMSTNSAFCMRFVEDFMILAAR